MRKMEKCKTEVGYPNGGKEIPTPKAGEVMTEVVKGQKKVLPEKKRTVLALKPRLAPYKAAVFPLLANKPKLVKLARKIFNDLSQTLAITWDDRGNIGKRYYSQDEVGTPWCLTVDFDSLEKDDVTVRDRDTTRQERVKIGQLKNYFEEKLK